jgi:hypothetical protein
LQGFLAPPNPVNFDPIRILSQLGSMPPFGIQGNLGSVLRAGPMALCMALGRHAAITATNHGIIPPLFLSFSEGQLVIFHHGKAADVRF